ncbi:RrF2 family transcriptional regulator [Alteromonas sp. a30]|uniref:RrF2 family transcriptional regulator n=1 Tax=Alteromonas sp. a30 TaxID=2730917 RepID=UPI0022830963|nr:Rrf2 family transcriptional regulator [Alteromonas sp. a30]MCY7296729.1 Rrf2 family transcriptional regulator [Alteromonas sp. a30]
MKINSFTNLTFRALIYMALKKKEIVRTNEIADAYQVSYNHLKKVMGMLADNQYVKGTKGRGGGFQLARPAEAINIGEVFRLTIEDVALAECFASPTNQCVISPDCKLRHILQDATSRFIAELDQYTLADLVKGREGALSLHLAIDFIELT